MSWFYRRVIRPGLFAQDAERVHERTLRMLGCVGGSGALSAAFRAIYGAPELPVETLGLRFPNPVGVAAGLDKRAEALPAWAALGFGFTELGAVTREGQPGNPQPRVFRAVAERAIVNRMGFNNSGAAAMAETLAKWKARGRWPNHPVGINLGKSKVTPLDQAAQDYADSMRLLLPYLDFFVVNVSSPNTPDLRKLQDRAALDEILAALQAVKSAAAVQKPVLVKVAPDLTFEALDEILELVGPREVAGIVATNTTIGRPETRGERAQRVYKEAGGLSGTPLRARSTEVIRHLYRQTKGKLPIIGVGGISSAEDAWEKIKAGATLLQIYTGLVYEGPGLVAEIVKGIRSRLEREGLKESKQAVGISSPA